MTSIDRLAEALTRLDAAVERAMAVGSLGPGTPAEARQAAANVAVDDLEAADAIVEAILSHILAQGGARGLLEVLSAAADRAGARLWTPEPRARAVALSAYRQAVAREQQIVSEMALPFWSRRMGVA